MRRRRDVPRDEVARLDERLGWRLDDASVVTGVPRTTLAAWIAAGELATVRIGGGDERGRYIILRDDLLATLRRLRRPAKWEVGQ